MIGVIDGRYTKLGALYKYIFFCSFQSCLVCLFSDGTAHERAIHFIAQMAANHVSTTYSGNSNYLSYSNNSFVGFTNDLLIH